MTDEAMKDLPEGLPHNYEGFAEYEEKLKQPCFYTGEPCHKGGCPRWVKTPVPKFSKLAPGKPEIIFLFQCKEDAIDNAITQMATVLNQIMIASQKAQQEAIRRQLNLGGGAAGPMGFGPRRQM